MRALLISPSIIFSNSLQLFSDVRLHCQVKRNELQEALKRQIALLWASNAPDQLIMALNPLRPFRMWNNNRIMKNYLRPHIERGIQEHLSGKSTGHNTILSLATKAFLSKRDSFNAVGADEQFMDIAIAQIKVFLFAGHDTTATALSYCYYLLNKNPSALATLRAEHDAVLGSNKSTARAQIAANPTLLNHLPYTSGVIKEALRLFPPVGSIRRGQPNFYLSHPETGKQYPTDGFMLFSLSLGVQRAEEFWPRATDFLPERWLAKEGEPLHVRKNAWRPFEQGPRNCIGQELAQIELRAILALTVREMDIEPVFPDDSPVVLGEKAYQVMEVGMITGHPKLGMPVRVEMRA
jgi:cytochrome P450